MNKICLIMLFFVGSSTALARDLPIAPSIDVFPPPALAPSPTPTPSPTPDLGFINNSAIIKV
jgi:hypothetical protein